MYQIAICEDETVHSDYLEQIVRESLEPQGISYQLAVFDKSSRLIDQYKAGNRYALLLLDIVMAPPNGMELAREIRKYDDNATIIFITSAASFAEEGYEVSALRYLRKPVDPNQLKKLIIDDYYNKYHHKHLTIENNSRYCHIPIQEIVYLEIAKRKVAIHLKDGSVHYSPGKLTDFLERLPQNLFVRCHQAYAVNINMIREFDRQTILTIQNIEIPVSRAYSKNVRERFAATISL